MQKRVLFVKKNLKINIRKTKNIVNLEINIELLHIAYVVKNIMCLKKIPMFFHNGTNYDYHFIIRELAEEFGKQFTCF